VVREATQTLAVREKGIVEARIPRFDGVERAVEVCRLDAHFADEVLGEVRAEGWRVRGGGRGEQGVVDEHCNGIFAVHGGCIRAVVVYEPW
jgi:hypothetical protein